MSTLRPAFIPLRRLAPLAFLLCLVPALGGCLNDSTTNPPVSNTVVDSDADQTTSTTQEESGPPPSEDTAPTITTGLMSISSGANYNCAITNGDQAMWCWGANEGGQLGDGFTNNSSTFKQTDSSAGSWAMVSAGTNHTCAIREESETLWCWGANDRRQTGVEQSETPIAMDDEATWLTVASGTNHTCAIKKVPVAGSDPINYTYPLFCWGDNSQSQLGEKTTDDQGVPNDLSKTPLQVGSDTDWNALSLGNHTSCAIKQDQSLWCWGDNDSGQLGLGDTTDRITPSEVQPGTAWSSVVIGDNHGCGITDTDELYCWGSTNDYGQLGQGNTTPSTTPVTIPGGNTWSAVAVGDRHTCAIKSDGTLWCWGNNSVGQLGLGTGIHQAQPTQVGDHDGWLAVSAGEYHTCAIDGDYVGYCWGLNDIGQLGQGNGLGSDSPRLFDDSTTWFQIDSGAQHSCGLKMIPDSPTLKTLWCGGGNNYGQLGIGSTANQTAPVRITGANGTLEYWEDFSTGHYHSCAITDTGALYCWGRNDFSQLGGSSTSSNVSSNWSLQSNIAVGADDWSKVVAGATHTCGIKGSNKELYCWGDNSTDQMGSNSSGTTPVQNTPTQIFEDGAAATTPFMALDVAAGGYYADATTSAGGHTCAIKIANPNDTQGSLWCWGKYDSGQLGTGYDGIPPPDGTPPPVDNPYTEPQQITSVDSDGLLLDPDFDNSWISVKAGNDYTCALNRTLKTEDMLYCWGNSNKGQLGSGVGGDAYNIPRILRITNVSTKVLWNDYDPGQRSACAITDTQRLRCWGDNNQMQLTAQVNGLELDGNGYALTHVSASFSSDWDSVAMGETHGCGIRENSSGDRSVYCWGEGAEYQFGDGNAWKTTPQELSLE